MTLPAERTNSLISTREFLRSLLDPKQTPRIPKSVRVQAYWCLRHFPSTLDLEITSKRSPSVFGKPKYK